MGEVRIALTLGWFVSVSHGPRPGWFVISQDKVMLGSDYPFPLGEHHPGKLIESVEDWEESTKVALFLTNPRSLD